MLTFFLVLEPVAMGEIPKGSQLISEIFSREKPQTFQIGKRELSDLPFVARGRN